MNPYSIAMALMDYVPVALFAAAVLLLRDLYYKMSKGAFALFAAGSIDIVCAGALKATYKLLYAANLCDFTALNEMFFPVQSIGFLLAGLGIVAMLRHRQGAACAVAPPVFSGTFLFVALMVSGLLCMTAGLSVLAVRMKKMRAIFLFALAFVCSVCMGYLSSQTFTQAAMNWIAQGVNTVGQACFFLGTLYLHKAGLAKYVIMRKGDDI